MNELTIVLQDFHFIRPWWCLALIPLILLLFTLKRRLTQQSGWQGVLAQHLYQHVISAKGQKGSQAAFYLVLCAWILTVAALAGPTWEKLPQPVYQLNTGKIVLIDMSLSMRARDVSPDRLTRAKFKAIDLVKRITEGETGLVAYAGDAFTISPLSSDGQNLTALIPSLSPEIMPVAGSEPVLGFETALELLDNAGYQHGEIYWLTDGIEHSQIPELTKLVTRMPYRLSILAVGTEDGAPIQLTSGELMKDNSGAIVIPKLSIKPLQALARKGQGRFVSMQSDDSDIDYLLSQNLIEQDEQNKADEQEAKSGDKWQELGPYLVLLLLPLAAYAFRRGILLVLVCVLWLPLSTQPVHASWFDDLWVSKDRQAKRAFDKQQYATAASTFEDPLWQGSAHYKNEDYEAALEAFKTSDTLDAVYNQGNALAQLGKLDEAIKAYEEVLKRQPGHQDAAENKASLEQLKDQQQEQEQDKSNSSDQPQEKDEQQSEQNSEQDQGSEDQSSSEQSEQENEQQAEQEEGQESNSEQDKQQDSSQSEQDKQQEGEQEAQQKKQEEQDAQAAAEDQEKSSQEETQKAQAGEEPELSDEEKEQMQRMQKLLNRVPDDPAYLLKRKMQIEHSERKRHRVPTQLQRNW